MPAGAPRSSTMLPLLALAWLAVQDGGPFVLDPAAVPSGAPANASSTENVDFGDLDLDGDPDVVMADGGDAGVDQNRIWINQGGLQAGVVGLFVDETAARAPAVLDVSRDVELGDIDGDADLDVYVSNTADLGPQGSRWWVNLGGSQGGALGFFRDETAERWVGLGGPGSSVPPSLVLPSGSFLDWSCDCDFGDLDGDGDLDLVHSTYGGAFSGSVPTRIFLNDGQGRFAELNPSGHQLVTSTIPEGAPGLWCEGVQRSGTLDATGAECDVATTALDVDVGDVDGDLDLDVLLGARQERPRLFASRLEGSALAPDAGGALVFRDVSGLAFPPDWATGTVHYEQELGDLDDDGDLDIYGVNWRMNLFSFDDVTLTNRGDGTFEAPVQVPGSGSDDNEADFLDYDNDGDLDVYVASFGSLDRLYRNDLAGGVATLVETTLVDFFATSLDADAADTDLDGDLDVLVAQDSMQPNSFLRNVTDVPDVHPPRVPLVEALGDAVAAPGPRRVRAHVYDNAPYYVTWYAAVALEASVEGFALPPFPATSSAGQVFRAELPGNLVGAVAYRVAATDAGGNAGASATRSVTHAEPAPFQQSYGAGTAGLAGGVPSLRALSAPFAGTTLWLGAASGAPAGTPAWIALATASDPAGTAYPGLLVAHVGGFVVVTATALDADGHALAQAAVPPGAPPGARAYAQAFVLDATAGGDALASSAGLEVAVP